MTEIIKKLWFHEDYFPTQTAEEGAKELEAAVVETPRDHQDLPLMDVSKVNRSPYYDEQISQVSFRRPLQDCPPSRGLRSVLATAHRLDVSRMT
jgi:hypothetical protein